MFCLSKEGEEVHFLVVTFEGQLVDISLVLNMCFEIHVFSQVSFSCLCFLKIGEERRGQT